MTSLVLAAALLAATASVREARVAVVIGHDVGLADEAPLAYAEADARRFHRLLVEAGGVEPERAYLALGRTAAEVEAVLAEATGRVEELARLGPVAFIVYASSHADEAALHLGGTELSLTRLRDRMARSQASLRLAIVDACRTPVRTKGGRPGPPVGLELGRESRVEGEVVITAAGLGEAAQEWGLLSGSLFSHHLTVGLRGAADLDGDGTVTLSEAYAYAYRRTSTRAVEGAGAQHPSFELDTRGFGEWPFTRRTDFPSTLVLSEQLEGRFFVSDRSDALVAEVAKRAGEPLRLGLPVGIYRLVRPEGRFAWVAEVNLAFGGKREVGPEALARVPLRSAALRGSRALPLHPWRLGLGYRAASGTVRGIDLFHLGELRFGRELGPWALRLELSGGRGGFEAGRATIEHLEARALVVGARLIPVDFGTLSVGLGLGMTLTHQTVEAPDQETIDRVFGGGDRSRIGGLPTGLALAGLTVPIPGLERVELAVDLQGGLAWVPVAVEGGELRPQAGARAGVDFGF